MSGTYESVREAADEQAVLLTVQLLGRTGIAPVSRRRREAIQFHQGPMSHLFEPFLDEDDIIEQARSQLPPPGPVVQVFRYHPGPAGKRRREYVGTVPAEGFDLSDIQRRFGGGDYHFQFRDSHGRYRGSGTAEIAGVIKRPTT